MIGPRVIATHTKVTVPGIRMSDRENVLKYYRVRHPDAAFSAIRWWDEGRKYELLKCISTLVCETEQERKDEEMEAVANDLVASLLPPPSPSDQSSNASGASSSSIESGKIVNRHNDMQRKLFTWFAHLRNATAVKHGAAALFECAVLLYRNWSIFDLESKVADDQRALVECIDAVNDIDSNANIEYDDYIREIISGEGYVSFDRIPKNLRQKPLPVKSRCSLEKFKIEVDSAKPIFDSAYKMKKRKKTSTPIPQQLLPRAKKPKDEVSSLSGLFD